MDLPCNHPESVLHRQTPKRSFRKKIQGTMPKAFQMMKMLTFPSHSGSGWMHLFRDLRPLLKENMEFMNMRPRHWGTRHRDSSKHSHYFVFSLKNEKKREHFLNSSAINFVVNRAPIKLILCDSKVIRFAKKKKHPLKCAPCPGQHGGPVPSISTSTSGQGCRSSVKAGFQARP